MKILPKHTIVILFCCFSTLLQSQNNPHWLPLHDFIEYDSNYIHFYNDSANYNSFFNKLDTLVFQGKGKVNIMQIGGSHIQADIWSDQMRKNFQQFAPDLNGGRGFLFPFTLAHTNNPYYYTVSSTGKWEGFRNAVMKHHATWGVSGITATTKDSLSSFKIVFKGNNTPFYDFNRIKVFHDIDSSNFSIRFVGDSCVTTKVDSAIGYTEFFLNDYVNSLEFEILKTDSNQTHFNLYGISLDNDDPGIIYNSIGVNGASTKSYLRCELFTQHLKAIVPDLVIFCIGINDAYDPGFCKSCYEENYDTLVDWFKSVNPNIKFLFVTNNDSYYKKRNPNKRVFKAREVMIKLSKKYQSGMWDMFNIMGGLGAIKTWQQHGLAKKDKVHLTKEGYIIMGDLMFSALIKEYDKHLQMQNVK